MKQYRKIQTIEVIEKLPNGDVWVRNTGDDSDHWIIPKEVFEKTYEEVVE